MMRRIGMPAALALSAGLAATGSQAATAAAPCLSHAEASGVMLAVAPDAIRAAGMVCASALPPTALLRQGSGPFLDGFRAASDRAWPGAKSAIVKLAGSADISAMMESEMMRPMIGALVAPMIVRQIRIRDCAAIDHIVTQLAPLPPRNLVEILVTALELDRDGKASRGETADFPLCPAGEP